MVMNVTNPPRTSRLSVELRLEISKNKSSRVFSPEPAGAIRLRNDVDSTPSPCVDSVWSVAGRFMVSFGGGGWSSSSQPSENSEVPGTV